MLEPPIIADEPVSALERNYSSSIKLILDLKEKYSLTILFISYICAINQIVDRVMVCIWDILLKLQVLNNFFNPLSLYKIYSDSLNT